MPLQNRVTPLGEVIATPERGLVYANRGCIHDAAGGVREDRHPTKRWIACQLDFRGRRRRPLMAPGKFTELFFLDEATALAAGHRPCGECRYRDYEHLKQLWVELHPAQRGADAIDEQLDRERRDPRTKQRRFHEAQFNSLPDGAFVLHGGEPHLVFGQQLLRWSPAGYTVRTRRPVGARGGPAAVITPPSLVALLATERTPLVPLVHPSALV
ncbi:MAG TPA: hypothetical protein VMB27_18730 [Solirubrobacteraceae bacterium]|nr:hypothetical protein [Solirubrobacteraceae bacterium]